MMPLIPRVLVRKGFFVLIVFLIVGSYAVHRAESNSRGVIGYSKTGCGSGGECHSPSRAVSTVVTIATQATQIVAGQTYNFTFSVKNTNGF